MCCFVSVFAVESSRKPNTKVMTRYTPESASGLQDE